MKGQKLKIIFKQDKAYLTTDKPMTFKQLGIPEVVKQSKSNAYWTIRVINYRESEKKIFCEIISYQIGDTEFENNQRRLSDKLNDLETISFSSIDTGGLLKTLNSTIPIEILPSKYKPDTKPQISFPSIPIVREPIKQTINETFFVPLKDIRFKLGGVSFDKKFKEYKKPLELTISNIDIKEEFDAVKNYFANVLKTKKIEVIANIQIIDNEITSIDVKSPEIDKIDKRLIDNVKFQFIQSTIKKKIQVDIDKSLFTMDEFFDTFADEKIKSSTFYNNEKELLEDIINISDTKHYYHLRYLSSKHAHNIMKLRFVHKPFSFIFLIEGEKNYHLIWETLDTEEATYVWHITKDKSVLRLAVHKIEEIINVIKVQGRSVYINSNEDSLSRIRHDYSEIVEGFIKWKGELESILY